MGRSNSLMKEVTIAAAMAMAEKTSCLVENLGLLMLLPMKHASRRSAIMMRTRAVYPAVVS